MTTTIREHAILLGFGIPTVIGVAASTAAVPGWQGQLLAAVIGVAGMAAAVLTVKRNR